MDSLDHFRGEVRTWLAENCPESQRQAIRPGEQYWGGRNATFHSEDARIWFERMRDQGWTAPEWPTEYGGGGLSEEQAKILKEAEFPPASALGSIFLFILLILVAVQRGYIGGRSYHTVRGQGFTTHKIRLGRWRYPIFTLVLLTAITTTVIPVIFLVMVTFMNSLGHFDIPEPWTLENWRGVLDDPILASSLTNTLLVGTGASLVGIFFYSLIAYVVVKSRFTARGVLDFISWLPWAVPGILLSLALLWTVFQTHILKDLYGTLYLLVLAMVIKSMPVGVQLTRSVLLQLSNELEEASKTCGASWTQTYRRIVLPLLFPTLVVVGLLIFVSVARDISTVVLLGTGASRTVALVALDYTSEGALEKAAVAALITVGLVVLAVLPARIFGGRIGITR